LRNGGLEIVGPGERGIRHLRHQLVANATMDEAFLQAGAMGCSRGFGACGRLGLTAALDSSRYSGHKDPGEKEGEASALGQPFLFSS
jgi:hypothetical protein